jgi:hypothetical protein
MTDTAKEEFKAEVITLSNLQHDRVLRFLGAVLDDKRMMLGIINMVTFIIIIKRP